MLKNSILPTENVRSILRRILILNIVIYMCVGILFSNNIFAAQVTYNYPGEKISSYPKYKNLIDTLKKEHPNWTFTILDTGLDWNEVIKNETVALHGRNLIYYTYSGSWVCSTCGDAAYDSGKWKCASEVAVAYYMDPRNWLNGDNIFQFENLAYNEEVHTIEGVQKILNSVPWANKEKITYTKTDGTQVILEKSYAQVIMEAAKDADVSPYHLAARMKQEQGAKQQASSTGCGTYTNYVGYYNFFNINATGSNIIGNALTYAKKQGWDNPEKAIKGGAEFIAKDYINRGQSTLYLQKFDVDNKDGAMYYHQYMQNVSAALTEGNTVRDSYKSIDMLDAKLNFVIPVYNNMPEEISPSPNGMAIVTQNVKVTGSEVIVREGRGTKAKEIAKVKKGDILLRIEVIESLQDGHYWDKVVLPDGRKGYIARDYIEKIEDVTNKNASAVANVTVNLRNGPGTTDTKIIASVTTGQLVTIIETGKYNNLDGYNWLRVKLSNGLQGYLASEFITETKETDYVIGYIKCNDDGKVNIRSEIGTDKNIITSLGKDVKVTVIQKSAGKANGYTWDKIVTSEGLEGYIANVYLRYEDEDNQEEKPVQPPEQKPNQSISENGNYKVQDNTIVCEPNTKVSDIKITYPTAVVKNASGKELGNDDLIGTGNVISVDGKNYTVVKMGDLNGDGVIKSADYILLKNYISNKRNLNDFEKKAADINKDGNIKSADYILVKNHISKKYKISI